MPSATRILVTCPKGLAAILADEVRALGLPVTRERPDGVETRGGWDAILRLNLHVRTGHRVLWWRGGGATRTPEDLYRGVRALPWEEWLPADGRFRVRAAVRTPAIQDGRFAALKVKDAIVDRFRDLCGRRPDTSPGQDAAGVFLHWDGEEAGVWLDTSGEPLSNRGYRLVPLQAPLRESLAAGLLLSAGWPRAGVFVSPMCGSGTLAIEAAWIARRRAPGLLREDFAFRYLTGFDAARWASARAAARAQETAAPGVRIVAADADAGAVAAARTNARRAGVEAAIEWAACDVLDTPVPPGPGLALLNPEYGERMGAEADLAPLYRRIGDFLRARCAGKRAGLFTANFKLARQTRLRPDRTETFWNGPIECRLYLYDIFERPAPAPREGGSA